LGCRIHMYVLFEHYFLNIVHTARYFMLSHVTCTLMSISNNDKYQLSSLVHTKPFPWKKEQPMHAPVMTVKAVSFWSDWESTF